MSNHTTFYFVSTCDLQILWRATNMHESLYIGMFVKRKPLATLWFACRSTWRKNTEKRPWAKHSLIRGINKGVLWPYSATDASPKGSDVLWISLGFMWICPYHLWHFFSVNVWECVQLSTKKGTISQTIEDWRDIHPLWCSD